MRTFEPGDTPLGAAIRSLVLDPATGEISPRAEALLYAADKAHHVFAVVGPALARGAVVVCDRYVDSMLAYQGAGRVLAPAEVEQIARWATDDLRPQLTVVLDLEPGRALLTITEKDRVEAAGDGFHERARQSFVELAAREPEHYLVLDAGADRDEIAAAVLGGSPRCCRRRMAAWCHDRGRLGGADRPGGRGRHAAAARCPASRTR